MNIVRQGVNMTNLWHSRLGHMSLQNMDILVKNGYLSDKDVHTLDFCEECVLGKVHKILFPTAKHTTTEVLGYVHSDFWGYVSNAESLSGCKYFLTLINDFSKKVWIRFLRSKDEVMRTFLSGRNSWKHKHERKSSVSELIMVWNFATIRWKRCVRMHELNGTELALILRRKMEWQRR